MFFSLSALAHKHSIKVNKNRHIDLRLVGEGVQSVIRSGKTRWGYIRTGCFLDTRIKLYKSDIGLLQISWISRIFSSAQKPDVDVKHP